MMMLWEWKNIRRLDLPMGSDVGTQLSEQELMKNFKATARVSVSALVPLGTSCRNFSTSTASSLAPLMDGTAITRGSSV